MISENFTLRVRGTHDHAADMEKLNGEPFPLEFDIRVHYYDDEKTEDGEAYYYGDCHLGCSQNYDTAEDMARDLLRRHGYDNVEILSDSRTTVEQTSKPTKRFSPPVDTRTTADVLVENRRAVNRVLFELACDHPDDMPEEHVRIIQLHAEKLFNSPWATTVAGKLALDTIEHIEAVLPDTPIQTIGEDYQAFEARLEAYIAKSRVIPENMLRSLMSAFVLYTQTFEGGEHADHVKQGSYTLAEAVARERELLQDGETRDWYWTDFHGDDVGATVREASTGVAQ
jgi:hypothetical protein